MCGSVSFLEPVHGCTYYGISPWLLEELLLEYGFSDVQVIPGISGFTLMLWTWLRRYGGKSLSDNLAIPLTYLWMVPIAALRFVISWLWWRFGWGTGHGMEWIIEHAPLEFAGHLQFVARKNN